MNRDQYVSDRHLTASALASMMQGFCVRPSRALVTDVQIDSRLCTNGSLFFALKGTQVDGLSFIDDAQKRGAVAVVVQEGDRVQALATVSCAVIIVDDVLAALHRLARSWVLLHPNATLIGITGSVGKTTTKEALATILGAAGPTAKTPGNLNSEYGLPLSVFSLNEASRWGVFELGIDRVGEMERLVEILTPSHALLTNIGISHLQKFGSTRPTAIEKAKIFHPALTTGFITRACKHRSLIEHRARTKLLQYGSTDINAVDLGLDGWRLTHQGHSFTIRTVGRHLLEDVVGAITVADTLGIEPLTIAKALEGFEPMRGRTSVKSGAITIIDDTYNASLDSTSTIVDYLSSLSWRGAKRVVLGPMKELGSQSARAHRTIGRLLASSSFGQTYLYGSEMQAAKEELTRHGYRGQLVWTEDFEELSEQVQNQTQRGDLVLLKASRSVAIDRLIAPLQGRWSAHA